MVTPILQQRVARWMLVVMGAMLVVAGCGSGGPALSSVADLAPTALAGVVYVDNGNQVLDSGDEAGAELTLQLGIGTQILQFDTVAPLVTNDKGQFSVEVSDEVLTEVRGPVCAGHRSGGGSGRGNG